MTAVTESSPAVLAPSAPRVRLLPPSLLLFEMKRIIRNRRFLAFVVAMPVILSVSIGGSLKGKTEGGISAVTYIVVSMATFGVLGAVFTNGGRIALERMVGWNRQLRLTSLSGAGYVASKLVSAYVLALLPLGVVFLLGALALGAEAPAQRWPLMALMILIGAAPIAVLGIWAGYLAKGDSAQAVTGLVYSLMGFLGGLWVPVEEMPKWLGQIVKVLPPYWSAYGGRAAVTGHWFGWRGLATLLVWTAIFGVLAAWAYQRDTQRAS